MAGCCGRKNVTYKYRYISPTGKVTMLDSETQAKAEVTSKGGSYTKVAT